MKGKTMATILEDQTIARHMTDRGFSIAIIRNGHSAGKAFQVVRANEKSQYVTIHNATSEAEARKLANKEWLSDMGRGPAMIY